ncbi:paar repeat-containing protein [Marinilabiliaceae bacterium JC017]|nr:paar repeat-containing protein [Marinilabiliaceae bacterium JC017]
MAKQQIATVGSMHVCPMCSGTVPHVGGPITGPGMPGATINGQPIAVVGDLCTCVGPPDTIVQGCPGVTINGKPVAVMGSMTAHGGQVTQGMPGVTINTNVPEPSTYMPLEEIPFPKITPVDVAVATVAEALTGNQTGSNIRQARENIEKIKEEAKEHGYLADYDFSL